MKRFIIALMIVVFAGSFFFIKAYASDNAPDFQNVYEGVFSAIDGETRELLESAGLDGGDYTALTDVSAQEITELIKELFGKTAGEKASLFGACLTVVIVIRLFSSFMSSSQLKDVSESIGSLFLVFLIISSSAAIADSCVRAIGMTKDFMLFLSPVMASVLAFSGNELSAVSVNTGVFAFAQGISVVFADLVVPLTAVGASLGAAAALNPVSGIEKFSSGLNRLTVGAMGFISGIFAAVLSIKSVIAGAGDSLALKGMRFIINGSVPIVGSAVGDALGSLTAGLGLLKNSAAILGVLAVVFINLPSLCSLLVWKLMLFLLSTAAQMFEIKKIPQFISVFSSVFSVIAGVMLFNVFVYIIALAIIITVKTGA